MIDELKEFRGQMAEDNIRKNVKLGNYRVSNHAHMRMGERKISTEKVEECIINGKSIEYQVDKKIDGFKVLFQEEKKHKPEIYTVVADREVPIIVTVCRTKEEIWEYVNDVLKRKEMHK